MIPHNSESLDLTNRVVAGYRVLHRLGRGGMSEVYLAFHENLRRHVALKVLRQDLVGSADHRVRFLQEARAAASLVHPNIVQVYDIGEFESVHFIAQEYIPGSNLRAYIQRRGSLPIPEAVSILIQAAAALQKASSIGIVHRDIKPENILLTSEGEVKVADFGLARARGQETNLTEVGITLGTPLYMSPEQIQDSSVDSRSDLYSLGVTAFHMLAGRPPFEGETALALAVQHMQNEPPKLDSIRSDIPPALSELVDRLLAKKPDDRISSATALLRSLRDIAESLPGKWHGDQLLPLSDLVVELDVDLAERTMRLQSAMLREKNRPKKRWMFGVGMGIATAVAAGIGFFSSSQWSRAQIIPDPKNQVAQVPQKPSIREQFFYALTASGVPEWRAVEHYYPPQQSPQNVSYNVKAWLHLARKCLEQKDLETAQRALQNILDAYNRKADAVDPSIHVLALVELMGVALEQNDLSALAQFRDDAQNWFKSLPEDQQTLVKRHIPNHLLPYWEMSPQAT